MAPMSGETFSQDDLLRAIEEEIAFTPKGKTTSELREITGASVLRIRRLLRQFKKEGRLVIEMNPRETLDGRIISYPTYRLKPKPTKAQ